MTPPADPSPVLPEAAAAQWVAAMRRGDWPAAFAINDAVLAQRDRRGRDDPARPYHQRWVWDGSPVAGQDVLVRCYHGLGDTLLFCRYLPELADRAASLTVEAPPALIPLLAQLPGPISLLPFRPAAPTPPRAVNLEIMELAHALRLGPDQVPPPWQSRPTAAKRLGLCWRAGEWDPDRSVPLSLLLAAIATDRELVSLQRGPAADQAGPDFINPDDRSMDILDTVALIRGTERVISVDTMVAHLAGSLGHPTLLLLKHDADWRWSGDGVSAWYPAVRQFRQDTRGDWSGALARIARAQRDPVPALR